MRRWYGGRDQTEHGGALRAGLPGAVRGGVVAVLTILGQPTTWRRRRYRIPLIGWYRGDAWSNCGHQQGVGMAAFGQAYEPAAGAGEGWFEPGPAVPAPPARQARVAREMSGADRLPGLYNPGIILLVRKRRAVLYCL